MLLKNGKPKKNLKLSLFGREKKIYLITKSITKDCYIKVKKKGDYSKEQMKKMSLLKNLYKWEKMK